MQKGQRTRKTSIANVPTTARKKRKGTVEISNSKSHENEIEMHSQESYSKAAEYSIFQEHLQKSHLGE